MKKINFAEKDEKESVFDYSVVDLAQVLSLELTYNQYDSVSDQEIEFWDNVSQPWLIDERSFKLLFIKYFRGDEIV